MTDLNLITVTEFGQYAPEIDTSKFIPDTVSGIISQASRQVSDYLEYTPLAEDIVDELAQGMVTTEGDLLIFPQKVPVQSVSAIGINKGTITVSLTLSNTAGINRFNLDLTRRNIRYPYNELTLQGQVLFTNLYALRSTQFFTKISYRGGFEVSALPAVIKQATILFAKDIFATQYNQMGASSLRQGAVSFTFGANGESNFIKSAKRLLGPYRRIK
jgi:hypothetical protein